MVFIQLSLGIWSLVLESSNQGISQIHLLNSNEYIFSLWSLQGQFFFQVSLLFPYSLNGTKPFQCKWKITILNTKGQKPKGYIWQRGKCQQIKAFLILPLLLRWLKSHILTSVCINISLEPCDLNQSARQEMQNSSIQLLPCGGFVKQLWSRAFMYVQPALKPSVKLLLQKQERHIYFPCKSKVRRVSFRNNNTIIVYRYIFF